MSEFIHKRLVLTPLSYCIVGPRESQALYDKIDFDKNKIKIADFNDINVIYPFYQYSNYEGYDPDIAQYYIPGSSVKGSVIAAQKQVLREEMGSKIVIDDFEIPQSHNSVVLKRICKYQYLTEQNKKQKIDNSKKQVKYDIFFPNVAFEMLAPVGKVDADIYYENSIDIMKMLNQANLYHRQKLTELLKYLTKCQENERAKKLEDQIETHKRKIKYVMETSKRLISIGGYKGLVRSSELENEGGVFIDQQTGLPYGLAEIDIVDCGSRL